MVSCVLQVLQKVNWNLLEKQTENGNAMKKIQSIFPLLWFVGIVLLFAACSQEELGTPFYAGQEVSISAALSNSNNNEGKKRISGKDNVDKIDLTWDEGDEILVTVGDKSAVFTLTSLKTISHAAKSDYIAYLELLVYCLDDFCQICYGWFCRVPKPPEIEQRASIAIRAVMNTALSISIKASRIVTTLTLISGNFLIKALVFHFICR